MAIKGMADITHCHFDLKKIGARAGVVPFALEFQELKSIEDKVKYLAANRDKLNKFRVNVDKTIAAWQRKLK